MADKKDPAVLFYTADFLASTVLWKDEEVGMYIKLLCIQHLQDGLTLEEIEEVCKGKAKVATKFQLCPDGLYRNPRMADEKAKRASFTASRRANASKRYESKTSSASAEQVQSICRASAEHMGNENINENINSNDNVVTKAVRHKYGEYLNVLLTDEELAKVKSEFPVDWAERIERLSEYIASSGKKYKSHIAVIRAWARRDADKTSTQDQHKTNTEPTQGAARFSTFDPQRSLQEAIARSDSKYG